VALKFLAAGAVGAELSVLRLRHSTRRRQTERFSVSSRQRIVQVSDWVFVAQQGCDALISGTMGHIWGAA